MFFGIAWLTEGGMEDVSPSGVTGSAIAGTYEFRAFSISLNHK